MASSNLVLVISLLFIIPLSLSRSIPSKGFGLIPPNSNPGPIHTNGKNYTKVCDEERFKDLGLDITKYAYCNISLPYEVRVRDLIGRMSLKEKVLNLGDQAQGAIRVGLPPYRWWSEALHGVSDVGGGSYFGDIVPGATSFPMVILSAASFNETLWKRTGQIISTEARAMWNEGHAGLTFWSPNINVVRDPRWGRTLETPGEDPFVVGRYSINFVRGMQDLEGHETAEDLFARPIKVSTCCKHYAAYDVDNWEGVTRYSYDARVHERDMVETFVRPFEMCVREGDASSVMCSYNRVNGIPVCADPRLLTQTIRDEWQLHGYIVSDCDSIEVMTDRAKWLGYTPVQSSAASMKAGLDLDCGIGNVNFYTNFTLFAVEQGKIRESDIDNALKNLFMTLMRVGYFDNIPGLESLGLSDICSEENKNSAADAARQGIVLLKNANNLLPLDPTKLESVSLVGPHVKATDVLIGNYAGKPCRIVSPYEAISKDVNVTYVQGCDVKCDRVDLLGEAVANVKSSGATIIFAGLDLSIEREDLDRVNLLLPGYQTDLINQIAEASPTPVVLVLLSAGGVDISFAEKNPKIGAIVWAGYPGEEGGVAIADVLFGRYNPGGKLPITWYKKDYVDQIPMTSMELRPVPEFSYPGRTYKFFDGPVLYPFGHGLSYTKFSYASDTNGASTTVASNAQFCKPLTYNPGVNAPACPSLKIDDLKCTETIDFNVTVVNSGDRDGDRVVLVYSKPPQEVAEAPLKQLVAFQRVFVQAQSTAKVQFSLNVCKALGIVEKTAYTVLPSGVSTIVVGDDESSLSFPVEVKFAV